MSRAPLINIRHEAIALPLSTAQAGKRSTVQHHAPIREHLLSQPPARQAPLQCTLTHIDRHRLGKRLKVIPGQPCWPNEDDLIVACKFQALRRVEHTPSRILAYHSVYGAIREMELQSAKTSACQVGKAVQVRLQRLPQLSALHVKSRSSSKRGPNLSDTHSA